VRVLLLAIACAAAACGGRGASTATAVKGPVRELPPDERVLALIPEGAQVVIEVDVARLRANPVVGASVARYLSSPTEGVPGAVNVAERVVLAAFGVGTAQAATVTLVVSGGSVEGARKVAAIGDRTVWALGPKDWVDQLEQRAALADAGVGARLMPSADLLALRSRAMPSRAPGASLRLTARLPFDARVALANVAGMDPAPAQVSVWGDVVDDLAIVVEADATDGAAKGGPRKQGARLEQAVNRTLARLGDIAAVRALGLVPAIADTKVTSHGAWVRVVFTVGPRYLGRVVERAGKLFDETSKSPE
jgi:hypothetical protein